MDFSFSINVDEWEADGRRKIFKLKVDEQKKFDIFSNKIKEEMVKFAPVSVGGGTLKKSIIANKVQQDMTQGIFTWTIGIDPSSPAAKYAQFQEFGRNPGPAPPAVIRDWVARTFGYEGRQLFFATKGVLFKLYKIGFNHKFAPYEFMAKTQAALNDRYIDQLLTDIGLSVTAIWER